MSELWDVYDAEGKFSGRSVPAGSAFAQGEFHKVVEIWIADARGRLLIQQRAHTLPILPGVWAMTTGRIQAGETARSGAVRELREELGIEAREDELRALQHIVRERELIWDIFLLIRDEPVVRFDPAEVENVAWVTRSELMELYDGGKMFHYPEMKSLLGMVLGGR